MKSIQETPIMSKLALASLALALIVGRGAAGLGAERDPVDQQLAAGRRRRWSASS